MVHNKNSFPLEYQTTFYSEKKTKDFRKNKDIILAILSIIFWVFLFLWIITNNIVVIAISVVIFIVTYILFGTFINNTSQSATFKAGFKGEIALKNALRMALSNEYTVFYNISTPYGDIDALVIGPTGVFAIEAKNHNGYITIDGDNWSRVKVGRGGTVYGADIGSPSLQAKRNANYVRNLLKNEGLDVWVQAVVVLTNPEVKVRVVKAPESVVVIGLEELKKVIMNGKDLLNHRALEKVRVFLV